MLNYTYAELYKARYRAYLTVFLGVLLALEGLFILGCILPGGTEFAVMLEALTEVLPVGLVVTLALVDLVFSGQYRHNMLKNECSFGIPRRRIYVGKFLAELLLGLAMLALVLTIYLGTGWLLARHTDLAAEAAALSALGYQLCAALPLWIATLSIVHLLFFLLRSDALAAVVIVLSASLVTPMLFIFRSLHIGPFSFLADLLFVLFPNTRFSLLQNAVGMGYLLENWLAGLGWTAVTLAVGLTAFQKREL